MPSMHSQRSGYRSSSGLSPASVAGVVIVHAALGAAIVSMTAIKALRDDPDVIWVKNIPATPPKADPAKAQPAAKTEAAAERRITTVPPVIDLPKPPQIGDMAKPDPIPLPGGSGGTGAFPDIIRTPDPVAPVMVEAKPDARYMRDFQPPYPAAMLRLQMEGNVTVRLTVGADGRVLDIALVSAADPAFYEATRKQALSRWRFTPATRDGVPVASERVMTVRFRLTD
ncbi:MAG: TonB family protein [Sphingobium sp.]